MATRTEPVTSLTMTHVTADVPSRTRPDRNYRVSVWPGGSNCQCEGHRYRGRCAHVDAVRVVAQFVNDALTPGE